MAYTFVIFLYLFTFVEPVITTTNQQVNKLNKGDRHIGRYGWRMFTPRLKARPQAPAYAGLAYQAIVETIAAFASGILPSVGRLKCANDKILFRWQPHMEN
jgi:hypothetical protein